MRTPTRKGRESVRGQTRQNFSKGGGYPIIGADLPFLAGAPHLVLLRKSAGAKGCGALCSGGEESSKKKKNPSAMAREWASLGEEGMLRKILACERGDALRLARAGRERR